MGLNIRVPRLGWKPRWFIDDTVLLQEGSRRQGRKLTYQALENGSNDCLTILVASLGLLTNSYAITASSFTVPMLAFVYWHDATKSTHEAALNYIFIAGAVLGSVLFAVFADLYGRRKLYGLDLIVLMVGLMGTVMTSGGYISLDRVNDTSLPPLEYSSLGSMDIQSWLLFWRFIIGVGIGGECPLTAVIASEFSPTQKRPRILAAVYVTRAAGIAAAAIATLTVTKLVQARHPYNQERPESSARAVDQIWRWVMGLGLAPALLTAILRFTIPESPRYTLDVMDNPFKASSETSRLRRLDRQKRPDESIHTFSLQHSINSGTPRLTRRSINHAGDTEGNPHSPTLIQFFWIEGNWRTLLCTILICFTSDWSIYATELNDVTALSKFWNGLTVDVKDARTWQSGTTDPNADIFSILVGDCVHLLLGGCIAAVTGSVLLVPFITRVNRRLLTWVMFLVTGALFVITGVTLLETRNTQNWGINVGLYALLSFSTNFGVCALTFIVPAELFPTKYRVTCHGTSTAFGKLGALLGMIFLRYVEFVTGRHKITPTNSSSTWLSYVYMIFAIPMFVGGFVAWLWIPELQDSSGRSKTLEQLAKGRLFAADEDLPAHYDSRTNA